MSGYDGAFAVMEPAPWERDDQRCGVRAVAGDLPQWSPLLGSGMTVTSLAFTAPAMLPQWSPLLGSGMTPSSVTYWGGPFGPQWSPLLGSGMTCRSAR